MRFTGLAVQRQLLAELCGDGIAKKAGLNLDDGPAIYALPGRKHHEYILAHLTRITSEGCI